MANVIKFRIKKTITPGMEKEMSEFLELLKSSYETTIEEKDDIFFTEYHLTTTWKNHASLIEVLEAKTIGRPYLIYPIITSSESSSSFRS